MQWYDKKEDILNVQIQDKEYWKSIELPNGIVIDVTKEGTIAGIEIMGASKIFSGDVKKVIQVAKPVSNQIKLYKAKFYIIFQGNVAQPGRVFASRAIDSGSNPDIPSFITGCSEFRLLK